MTLNIPELLKFIHVVGDPRDYPMDVMLYALPNLLRSMEIYLFLHVTLIDNKDIKVPNILIT